MLTFEAFIGNDTSHIVRGLHKTLKSMGMTSDHEKKNVWSSHPSKKVSFQKMKRELHKNGYVHKKSQDNYHMFAHKNRYQLAAFVHHDPKENRVSSVHVNYLG